MIEFKFSCPNCEQHIQCNDAYSGLQINCPTCKNQIVVPQPPLGSRPVSPATTPIPRASAQAPVAPSPTVPSQTASARLPVPTPARRKFVPRWGMIAGAAAVLVFIGVVAYVFFTSAYSDSEEAVQSEVATVAKTKPVAISTPSALSDESTPVDIKPAPPVSEKPRSINTEAPSADEILRKVIGKYDSLTSYSASGTAASIIDMSGVDADNLPGMSGKIPQSVRDSKEFKERFSKPQKTGSEFSVKLGRPNLYLVEWEGQLGPAKSKGATWSSGDGDFLVMEMGKLKYVKMQNRDMALASATGVSGGAANTMPHIFFKGNANILDLFKNPVRHEDEKMDNVDCYVCSGVVMGMEMILWIDKENFFIRQKQQVMGGKMDVPEITEEQIQDAIKQLGGNPTREQEEQIRSSMKKMKAMTSQIKGTMTETYRDIKINQPFKTGDFNHEVPPGAELSSSMF